MRTRQFPLTRQQGAARDLPPTERPGLGGAGVRRRDVRTLLGRKSARLGCSPAISTSKPFAECAPCLPKDPAPGPRNPAAWSRGRCGATLVPSLVFPRKQLRSQGRRTPNPGSRRSRPAGPPSHQARPDRAPRATQRRLLRPRPGLSPPRPLPGGCLSPLSCSAVSQEARCPGGFNADRSVSVHSQRGTRKQGHGLEKTIPAVPGKDRCPHPAPRPRGAPAFTPHQRSRPM